MNDTLGKVVLIKDINPEEARTYFIFNEYDALNGRSDNLYSSEFQDRVYFTQQDEQGDIEVFVTDGTSEGTEQLTNINAGDNRNRTFLGDSFTEFNDKLYFKIDAKLWVTDGTTEGTQLISNIGKSGNFITYVSYEFTEFNGKLYFEGRDETSGDELWVSDGTTDGTGLFIDINPGSGDSNIDDITKVNDKLYFTADNGMSGRELYVSDGTPQGTELFTDVYPGSPVSNPEGFTEFNGKLYFSANNSENGRELWVTEGTVEEAQLVADIVPGSNGSYPTNFIEFNNKLYFSANNGENGRELWVTDGTTEGTLLVADINPGSSNSNPKDFIESNNKLYFTAFDDENGRELWVTDGTPEGTLLVADINTANNNSNISARDSRIYSPRYLTEFNNKLYFSADNGENGRELWVTDGTTEGTLLVADIQPSAVYDFEDTNIPYGYDQTSFYNASRYFIEFKTSSNPSGIVAAGNELFFFAETIVSGRGDELFKLTFEDSPTNLVSGTDNKDNLIGTDSDDEIFGGSGNDGIVGESGNDALFGEAGNDLLDGGGGFDTLDGGEGTDTAVYQFAPAAATVTLGEEPNPGTASDGYGGTDSLFDLENVIGSEFDDNLTGNSANNSLTGRDGNDTIAGGEGNDFLTGSNGADILNGGAGSDRFIYFNANEGGDTIADFAVGTDKIIAIASGLGGGLSAGELPVESFIYGGAATSTEQRFIFNDASRELFFDADGSGAASQQLIATFESESKLSAGDIQLL